MTARFAWVAAIPLLLVACGDNGDFTPDFGSASTTFPATKPPLPVIVNGGGTIMTDVHVQPMYFSDSGAGSDASDASDDEQPALDTFLADFAASPSWPQMVSEYGVGGELTIDPSQVLPMAPPATGDDFTTMIQAQLATVDAATLAQTIYLFHFAGSQIFTSGGDTSCSSFAGFHGSVAQTTADGAPKVIVALAWSCESSSLTLDPLDVGTIVETHELVEAATDPFPNTAWGGTDKASEEWELHFGGEVGDMCEGFPRRIYRPDDLGFFIQRTWSNVQIAGFHDPCLPLVPGDGAFFATVPVEPDVDSDVRATNIPLDGSSRTIELQFLSDAPTGQAWIVEPLDEDTLDGNPASLEFSLDRNSGENGNLAHLTITPVAGVKAGLHPYRLLSTLGGIQNVWFGAVDVGRDPGE